MSPLTVVESATAGSESGRRDSAAAQSTDAQPPERRRIVMIGPLPPFRGGIAQHTMMLARALATRTHLLVLSYRRQYPRFLYPGTSDIDPELARLEAPWVRYVLDSLNPLSWRRTADMALAHRPDAILLPWWTVYWAPCVGHLTRRLVARGVPIVFICHNVVDHDASAWKHWLTRRALRRGDVFIVQSAAERDRLRSWRPGAEILVQPHPVYDQYPEPAHVPPRRAALELLFFGLVRPYKGLDVLLQAVASLHSTDVRLTIAGEIWRGMESVPALIDRLGIADRVELLDRYIPESEAAMLFARADAVILPYRRATGSGVLALAFRYRKPVIASRVAGLEELIVDGQNGFLVAPESPAALAAAIEALTAERAAAMAPAVARSTAMLTWESLADAILASVGRRCARSRASGDRTAAPVSS